MRGLIHGVDESACPCYVCVTKLARQLQSPLRLMEKLLGEAASDDFSAFKDALDATHASIAILSSADEHGELLCIEAAAAHLHGQNKIATFYGWTFYF